MMLEMIITTILLAAPTSEWTEAREASIRDGRPIVAVLTADWCQPCQQLKKKGLPAVKEELRRARLVVVDVDGSPRLASALARGRNLSLPTVVVFKRESKGKWRRYVRTGYGGPASFRAWLRSVLPREEKKARVAATFVKSRSLPPPAGLRKPLPPPIGLMVIVEKGDPEDHPHGPTAKRPDLFLGGTLKRLPGPTWWGCPTCGSSTCTMYLGQHLRGGTHGVGNAKLNEIGYRNWYVYHDNLHNVTYKAPARKESARASSGCVNCRTGRRGWFR